MHIRKKIISQLLALFLWMLAVILLASVFAPVLAVQDNSTSSRAASSTEKVVHTNRIETYGISVFRPYYEGEEGGKVSDEDKRDSDKVADSETLASNSSLQVTSGAPTSTELPHFDTPVHDMDVREMLYQLLVLTPPENRPKSPSEIWYYNPAYAIEFCEELMDAPDYEAICAIVTSETRNVSFEAQLALAYEVINRYKCWKFPSTIHDVVYAPGQYYSTDPLILEGSIRRPVTEEDVTDSVRAAVAHAFFFPEDDISNGAYFHITPSAMAKSDVDRFYALYEECYTVDGLVFFTKDYGAEPEDWDGNYEVNPMANVYFRMQALAEEGNVPSIIEYDDEGNIIWVNEDYPDKEIVDLVIQQHLRSVEDGSFFENLEKVSEKDTEKDDTDLGENANSEGASTE